MGVPGGLVRRPIVSCVGYWWLTHTAAVSCVLTSESTLTSYLTSTLTSLQLYTLTSIRTHSLTSHMDFVSSELHQGLQALAEEQKRWRCTLLFDTSEPDQEADIIDLCKHLDPDTMAPPRYPPSTNYMFPSMFHGIESKASLVSKLKLSAIRCGYSLVIAGNSSGMGSAREMTVRLACDHAHVYQKTKPTAAPPEVGPKAKVKAATGTKRKGKKRVGPPKQTKPRGEHYRTTTTKSLDKAETCSFLFSVFVQAESAELHPGRWFLSTVTLAKVFNCNLHEHHYKLDPSSMHIPLSCMTQEEALLLSGQPVVRGERLPSLVVGPPPSPNDSMILDGPDDDGFDMELVRSPAANVLLGRDVLTTQRLQQLDAAALTEGFSNLNLHAELTAIVKVVVGLAEGDPEIGRATLALWKQDSLDIIERASAGNTSAGLLEFSQTGSTRKRSSKRIRGSHEW